MDSRVPEGSSPAAIAVCVIGMGRSGTSAVASLLAALGVDLGPSERMLGAAPGGENPRGCWEQRQITQLNDELLSHLGGGWYDSDSPAATKLIAVADTTSASAAAGHHASSAIGTEKGSAD